MPAEEFQRGSNVKDAVPTEIRSNAGIRKGKYFGCAVQDEEVSADDAYQGKDEVLIRSKKSHGDNP
nr:hypothetical protein [Cardiobacterium valvarum]